MLIFSEEEVEERKKVLIQEIASFETKGMPERLETINQEIDTILSNNIWNTIGGSYFMSKLSDSITEAGNRAKYIQVYSRKMKNADISYQLNRNEYGSHLITKTTGSTK